MPETLVHFYQEKNGVSPVVEWLQDLERTNRKAFVRMLGLVELLEGKGNSLRRPHTDILRDGIYELRATVNNVNYRLLYFYHGRNVAIVSHGLTKERVVPDKDIDLALARKRAYSNDPDAHTYAESA